MASLPKDPKTTYYETLVKLIENDNLKEIDDLLNRVSKEMDLKEFLEFEPANTDNESRLIITLGPNRGKRNTGIAETYQWFQSATNPLFKAIMRGNLPIIQSLLKHGANPNRIPPHDLLIAVCPPNMENSYCLPATDRVEMETLLVTKTKPLLTALIVEGNYDPFHESFLHDHSSCLPTAETFINRLNYAQAFKKELETILKDAMERKEKNAPKAKDPKIELYKNLIKAIETGSVKEVDAVLDTIMLDYHVPEFLSTKPRDNSIVSYDAIITTGPNKGKTPKDTHESYLKPATGYNPLYRAIMLGNVNVIKRLLERGADPNKIDLKTLLLAIVGDHTMWCLPAHFATQLKKQLDEVVKPILTLLIVEGGLNPPDIEKVLDSWYLSSDSALRDVVQAAVIERNKRIAEEMPVDLETMAIMTKVTGQGMKDPTTIIHSYKTYAKSKEDQKDKEKPKEDEEPKKKPPEPPAGPH